LVYADDVNILGGSIHAIKKNAESLVVASKETGLEATADNAKYMVMSRDQSAGRSNNIMNDNISLEMVEQLRYFGTHLTNQNSVQEEIKNRLKLGNSCYHSVQNFSSCSFLFRNIKIEV
jgi:hypothetical protein